MTALDATAPPHRRQAAALRAHLVDELTRLELAQGWAIHVDPFTEACELVINWTPEAMRLRDDIEALVCQIDRGDQPE